jgi:hypothetical protein
MATANFGNKWRKTKGFPKWPHVIFQPDGRKDWFYCIRLSDDGRHYSYDSYALPEAARAAMLKTCTILKAMNARKYRPGLPAPKPRANGAALLQLEMELA